MLEFVYLIIAMAFIFLTGSIVGERDAKFGYILIPLVGLLMWSLGWLPDIYVASVVPLVLGLGIITFLREQFRDKFAGGGSASSLIWRIMAFVVFLQFAIIFVNGVGVMQANSVKLQTFNSTYTESYTIANAQTVYGGYTSVGSIDQLTTGLTLVWTAWNVTWQMIFGLFTVYPDLMNVFHMPSAIAAIVAAGFYIMVGIEVFVLLMFRTRPPEV